LTLFKAALSGLVTMDSESAFQAAALVDEPIVPISRGTSGARDNNCQPICVAAFHPHSQFDRDLE
jgi:hypothetical protein